MKCEEVEGKIIDYLDGKLDEKDNLEIEKHLETCERCLDEMRDIHRVMQLIANEQEAEPDDSLRINFYHMLHGEIKKAKDKVLPDAVSSSHHWYYRGFFRAAAGIALLICGVLTGMIIFSRINNSNRVKLEQLQSEVTAIKKAAMFSMLRDESSSYRIQAVYYADEINTPDENVINALVRTLNHDKNVNVRMAAAYALAKYTDHKSVCDSLVQSLSYQSDPILQVTLINILVEKREKSAYKPIQEIIRNENTLQEVKNVAQNGIKRLI
jgi:hypothetical protein